MNSKIQVIVNQEKLRQDLEEKRFLKSPRLHPGFVVFLGESVEGETPEFTKAREAVKERLRKRGLDIIEEGIVEPPLTSDVTASPETG